jgi:hypothetical protein
MINRENAPRQESLTVLTAQDRLRSQLLRDALGDALPMGHVTSLIAHDHLAETVPGQQELALRAIRSLLEDGLMEIGDSTGEVGTFVAWDLSVDAAMERVHDRYIGHYDDPPMRVSNFWLGLTDSGRHLAEAMCREP